MSDPEPWTPEERFSRDIALVDEFGEVSCLTALREMIESDRAEIGRLTETVNRQDRTISDLRESLSIAHGEIARASLESPTAPETVTVPRSLVEALREWRYQVVPDDGNLTDAYDDWEAGQG